MELKNSFNVLFRNKCSIFSKLYFAHICTLVETENVDYFMLNYDQNLVICVSRVSFVAKWPKFSNTGMLSKMAVPIFRRLFLNAVSRLFVDEIENFLHRRIREELLYILRSRFAHFCVDWNKERWLFTSFCEWHNWARWLTKFCTVCFWRAVSCSFVDEIEILLQCSIQK